MAGKVKELIDKVIARKAQGNPILLPIVKAKLIMKGINPDKYTNLSPDDPVVMDKLKTVARELGVQV